MKVRDLVAILTQEHINPESELMPYVEYVTEGDNFFDDLRLVYVNQDQDSDVPIVYMQYEEFTPE